MGDNVRSECRECGGHGYIGWPTATLVRDELITATVVKECEHCESRGWIGGLDLPL